MGARRRLLCDDGDDRPEGTRVGWGDRTITWWLGAMATSAL